MYKSYKSYSLRFKFNLFPEGYLFLFFTCESHAITDSCVSGGVHHGWEFVWVWRGAVSMCMFEQLVGNVCMMFGLLRRPNLEITLTSSLQFCRSCLTFQVVPKIILKMLPQCWRNMHQLNLPTCIYDSNAVNLMHNPHST